MLMGMGFCRELIKDLLQQKLEMGNWVVENRNRANYFDGEYKKIMI